MGYCVQCDARTNANCTGVAPIPNDGYWVSHPRSPLVHRCLVDAACLKTARGRRRDAAADAMFSWQMRYRDRGVQQLAAVEPATGRPMYENYTALQCSEGYQVRGPGCAIGCRVSAQQGRTATGQGLGRGGAIPRSTP